MFLVVESVVYVDVPRERFIFIHAYVVLLLLRHSFNFYRSPIKLREGNVFADVCHSVHKGGRAITQCVLPLYLTPQTIPPGAILTSRTIPPSGPNPWYHTPVPYHLPGPYPSSGPHPEWTSGCYASY